MADDNLERQHQATSKRLSDLRAKGQTLRSRDLTSGLVFILAIIMLVFLASEIINTLRANFTLLFADFKPMLHSKTFTMGLVEKIAISNFLLLLPLFITILATALLSPLLFGGWNFTLKPIQFKFETLHALNNLKNIFSKRIFTNVVKSLLKVTVLMSVLVIFAYTRKNAIFGLINLPIHSAINEAYFITKEFIFIIASSLVAIILFDVIAAYVEFQKKYRMTSQELKEENRETEGNETTKRKQRSAQIAIMLQRLSVSVPRATVIITNPTHYAVAIRYNDKKDKAPKVLAKGKNYMAQQIRQLAIKNGVSIYQAPVLARAIFKTTKLNAEINPGLYMAVAIVLSYVQQLKHYQQGNADLPMQVSDLQIPPEFIYHE